MLFAFKKYVPKDTQYMDEYYTRFVDEIKILFKISHPNIVRIYNYYLYPELKLGYLQMEFVDGVSIDKYELDPWGKEWHDIFIEVVSAFEYLESIGILHRDIRPTNILIDKNEKVKIIDFGFGKGIKCGEPIDNSVLLNWPVTELPEEINLNNIYNHQTEIYFVGKLFYHLLGERIKEFKYNHIIEKMIKVKPGQRYKSFNEVSKAISIGILSEFEFAESEKEIYLEFANQLTNHITSFNDKFNPITDLTLSIKLLAELIRDSALEKHIQANDRLISCFVNGSFNYNSRADIPVESIKNFYKLLISLDTQKPKIVLDNIFTRLSKIKVNVDDGLPF